jgi:hypothetical protein
MTMTQQQIKTRWCYVSVLHTEIIANAMNRGVCWNGSGKGHIIHDVLDGAHGLDPDRFIRAMDAAQEIEILVRRRLEQVARGPSVGAELAGDWPLPALVI